MSDLTYLPCISEYGNNTNGDNSNSNYNNNNDINNGSTDNKHKNVNNMVIYIFVIVNNSYTIRNT